MALILNWLWQGSAVALVATIVLALIRRSSAHDRYLALWAALVSVLALPIVQYASRFISSQAVAGAAPVPGGPLLEMPVAWWTSTSFVLLLWSGWLAITGWRLVRSVISLRRVKRALSGLAPSRQERLSHWRSVRTRGRQTNLTVCDSVRSAAVLGCGAPAIAISPSLLDRLSDEDLDRIVIHEWAHVQRRDDWTHVLQSCITTVAGWHPAVWWLDRQLHIEREVACDEMAVAITGSAKGYATSLLTLASLTPVRGASLPVIAAIAPLGLRGRVTRILMCDRRPSSWTWRAAAACAGVALSVVAATLGGIRAIEAATVIVEARAQDALLENSRILPASRQTQPSAQPAAAVTSIPPRHNAGQSRMQVPRDVTPASTLVESPESLDAAHTTHIEKISSVPLAGAYNATAPDISTSSNTASNAAQIIPWRAAADGGVAIGRESRDAAVTTAGYFTRLGKRIAGSF